jgi:hypothetical protein
LLIFTNGVIECHGCPPNSTTMFMERVSSTLHPSLDTRLDVKII